MNPGKDSGILVLCVEKCIFAQVSCVRKCSCMDRKLSIRFYKDREVRAVWDGELNKWWFSVLDIIGVLNEQDDYSKNRNYWKYLKTKLKKEDNELVSATNQLKMQAFMKGIDYSYYYEQVDE